MKSNPIHDISKKVLNIKSIEFIGEYGFVRILPSINYDKYKYAGFNLPKKKKCKSGKYWINTKHCFIRIILKNGSIFDFEIKRGFVTDFASIPRVFWWFIGNDDTNIIIAAILHDIMFATNAFSFSNANFIFLQVMAYYGMSYFKRKSAFNSVRLFGHGYYKKSDKEICSASKYVNVKKLK